jgi:hypothetical protein
MLNYSQFYLHLFVHFYLLPLFYFTLINLADDVKYYRVSKKSLPDYKNLLQEYQGKTLFSPCRTN